MLEYKHLHLVLYTQVCLCLHYVYSTAAYTAEVVNFSDLPYYLTMLCDLS